MYRSYQSVLPCQNKLLQSRWDRQNYEEHRRKIASAGPTVDTKAPRTYLHLHLKLKKLQLEEERLATVERDNRILLEKMHYIMRTEGRIDNKNDYEYKSLNREKRQRELLRVTEENQSVLKRIMMRQPEYDHFRWQADWEENQRYMDNIAHYPREWWLMTPEGRKRYGQRDSNTRGQSRKSQRSGANSARSTRSEGGKEGGKRESKSEGGKRRHAKEEKKKEDEDKKKAEEE